MNPQTIKRFWAKVNKTESCWLWMGSKRNKGYGAFVWADGSGKVIQGRAHRFAYELLVGEIPSGMMVLHRCDTPACVNPDHLFLGTNADNVKDMLQKGRHISGGTYTYGKYPRGENHHAAKLTVELVCAIRKDKITMSYSQLSQKYNLSLGHLHRIVTRKAWKHVS